MAELWCNLNVPPAPGKGVKDEQGLRGQDGLEKGSELGGGSPAAATQITRAFALWFVALSQGAGSVGTLGVHRDGDKEQSGCLRCHPDLRAPLVPPGQRHQLLWLFPLWSCPLRLHRERGPSERQYKYHTSPLAS